jgi:hypothetical protein
MQPFQVPLGTEAAYSGQVDANVFELASPDTAVPTHHIRTTQDWGVSVNWTASGAMVPFLVDEFRVSLYIESIGPGADTVRGPVVVNTMAGPLTPPNTRTYHASVDIPAGDFSPGVYKIAVLVQLHDDAGPGTPYPIVSSIELPLVTIFTPA